MAISLPDTRGLSDDLLEALRLRALRACELGFTEAARFSSVWLWAINDPSPSAAPRFKG